MTSSNPNLRPPTDDIGELLRYWREMRGKNQLDLSLDTGVSQRHLSFIENKRSVPSRQTLMDIAQALDIPFRDRNALLLAAGYAPLYSEGAWNSHEMKSITKALERMLTQHNPFPAVVMDRYWNVLMTNESAPRFFNCFIDMAARKGPRNILHLTFDPEGMRPFVANWENVAKTLIQRVHREAVGRLIDERTKELLAGLMAYPDVKADWKAPKVSSVVPITPDLPMIPISFAKGGQLLNYFSMVTTVGTPQTVAAQELRIETMFPADEATERAHVKMIGRASA
jgi:transcriptional regulator with XRE-family HTH domain